MDFTTLLQKQIELAVREQANIKEAAEIKFEKELNESAMKSLHGIPHNNWTAKAYNCIQNEQRFMKTTEIFDYVANDIYGDIPRNNAFTALSLALNNMCKNGRLGRLVAKGTKGYYYGLTAWFDGDKVKQKYVDDIKARRKHEKKVKQDTIVL